MKRESSEPTPTFPASTSTGSPVGHGRRTGVLSVAAMTVIAVALTSCGGDDDASVSSTSTTVAVTVAPVTTLAAPVTTAAPTTTTTPPLVTDGAKLIVANASGINGAAGRMTDALAIAGYSTGTATNHSGGQLEVTIVYYDPANTAAQAVANSVRLSLGGGAIQVLEMGVPAPVDTGEVGDASIVVAMGNDVADKSLAELQGLVASADDTTDDSTVSSDG